MTNQRPAWADDLLDLAAQEATGRFTVACADGDEGWITLRDGELTGVSAAARRPLLSRRLTAFGLMTPDQVKALLDTIRHRAGMRLLDVLVHDRLVPDSFIHGFLRNTMAEQLASLLAQPAEGTSFAPGRVPRSPTLIDLHEVLATALAVPHELPADIAHQQLTPTATDATELTGIHRAVVTAAGAHATVLAVADDCGLTAAETLQVIADLRQRKFVELQAATNDLHPLESVALAPPTGPASRVPGAPVIPAARPAPMAAPPPRAAPEPAPAAAAPEPVPTLRPLAPEPVEPEPAATAPRAGAEGRREAINALKSLTESVVAESAPHPPAHEPQAEVTTTSPRVWSTRPARPADPMESGDVLRELKSLGD